jgi:P27 family predicted phage terminase small subunit
MSFDVIPGGGDAPEAIPEPDWTLLYSDELDIAAASGHWRTILAEMREAQTVSAANGHAVKRLVIAYVQHDQAARMIAEQSPVIKAKRSKSATWNPWWTVLKDAAGMASAAEAELGLAPRRRTGVGKVQRTRKVARAADAYLKPIAK